MTAADAVQGSSATWDGLTAAEIARLTGARRVLLFEEVESTQDVAAHAAAERDGTGTLVLADSQRAGRGRLGRSWASRAGSGVWCTWVADPRVETRALDVLTIRIGLGLAQRLDALAGERVGLKWPNDLLLRAGKLGGILVESRTSHATLAWMGIGVGVNVMPPEGVAGGAGLPAGARRVEVLKAIVSSVRDALAGTGHLTPAELKEYAGRDRLSGRRLVSPSPGIARGIEDNGCLIIETPDGMEYRRAGTVQLAEEAQ